ncbi:MAG: hypothetical protein ACE5JJ_11370 [Nitrospinota bacterium]
MDLWLTERHTPNSALTFRVERVLASEKTPYQRLEVVHRAAFALPGFVREVTG